jgi:hypothetical protein
VLQTGGDILEAAFDHMGLSIMGGRQLGTDQLRYQPGRSQTTDITAVFVLALQDGSGATRGRERFGRLAQPLKGRIGSDTLK